MRILQIIPVLCLLSAYRMYAQDVQKNESRPILLFVGPASEFSFGIDDAAIPVYSGSADCGLFSGGRTFTASLGGTLVAPALFSQRLGLTGSLHFSFSSGRLTASPVGPLPLVDNESGKLVSLEEEYRLSETSWIVACDLLVRSQLSDRIAIALGPSFGYRLSSVVSQTENILAPEDYRLSNGHKEREMTEGLNPDPAGFTLGPVLSATYALRSGEHTFIVPGVTLRADLLSSLQGFSWRSYSAGLSLGLLFDVTPIPSEPPPHPLDPVVPAPPYLAASVEMFGVDEHDKPLPTARIQVFETFFQRSAPIIPAAFFERGENVLPDRYILLNSEEARAFLQDDLAKSDLVKVQHQLLNIIGSRLHKQSKATVTLVGSVSGDEPPGLARARAEAVRLYLTQVWEIDSSRVRIKQGVPLMQRSSEETEDGRSDNRRVEITSDDLSILSPVVTTEIVRDFNPPLIKMRPGFEAEAGVKEWRLVVSQGENEVARYSSNEDDASANTDMSWHIVHDRVDSALSPLVATLTVEDSTGAVVTANAVLPLTMIRTPKVVDQRVERRGDRERLAWTLVGFDFSSAEPGPQNGAAVEGVADAVRDGAQVRITGYTDRIGDQEHNKGLATERAANVAETLRRLLREKGVEDVAVNMSGAGVETERFNNDLPEGRFLSRGVGIEVEQKMEVSR